MTIKSNVLMITAAAFISTGAAFAQSSSSPTPVEKPDIAFLLDLLNGDEAPTRDAVRQALLDAGYVNPRVRLDSDGEARIRFVDENGQQWRVRVEGGEVVRFRANDDGMNDTSDANGADTSGSSDTSDSNGGSSDNTSGDNGGSTSGGNGGSSGGGNSGSGGSDS